MKKTLILSLSALVALGYIASISGQTKSDYPTQLKRVPLTDIRTFGAKCNGTDQNTAVQAALAFGATVIFIPQGCTWTAPGGIIPGSSSHFITYVGEDSMTSIIRSNATPSTVTLQAGPQVQIQNMNLLGNTSCGNFSGYGYTKCPMQLYINEDSVNHAIVSNGYMGIRIESKSTNDFPSVQIITNGGDGIFLATVDTPLSGSALRVWGQTNMPGNPPIYLESRVPYDEMFFVRNLSTAAAGGHDLSFYKTQPGNYGWIYGNDGAGVTSNAADLLAFDMGLSGAVFTGNYIRFGNATQGGLFKVDYLGNTTALGTVTAPNVSVTSAFSYQNYGVCYMSSGVLGHCTTALGAGGTCTCASN